MRRSTSQMMVLFAVGLAGSTTWGTGWTPDTSSVLEPPPRSPHAPKRPIAVDDPKLLEEFEEYFHRVEDISPVSQVKAVPTEIELDPTAPLPIVIDQAYSIYLNELRQEFKRSYATLKVRHMIMHRLMGTADISSDAWHETDPPAWREESMSEDQRSYFHQVLEAEAEQREVIARISRLKLEYGVVKKEIDRLWKNALNDMSALKKNRDIDALNRVVKQAAESAAAQHGESRRRLAISVVSAAAAQWVRFQKGVDDLTMKAMMKRAAFLFPKLSLAALFLIPLLEPMGESHWVQAVTVVTTGALASLALSMKKARQRERQVEALKENLKKSQDEFRSTFKEAYQAKYGAEGTDIYAATNAYDEKHFIPSLLLSSNCMAKFRGTF